MDKQLLFFNFLIALFLGTSIYVLQKIGVQLPYIINNFANDFLIIPITLSCCLFVIRWLINNHEFVISKRVILLVIMGYSLFFEYYLPNFNERYTADVIDVLMYFFGGFWFYGLQQIDSGVRFR